MTDPNTLHREWMAQHARCETCAFVARKLIGLECRLPGLKPADVVAEHRCPEWAPFPDFAPAYWAMLIETIDLDDKFFETAARRRRVA